MDRLPAVLLDLCMEYTIHSTRDVTVLGMVSGAWRERLRHGQLRFVIPRVRVVSSDMCIRFPTMLRGLRKINLRDNASISRDGFRTLGLLVRLEVLSVSMCRNFDDSCLRTVCHLRNLQRLDVSHCNALTISGVRHLPRLPQLTWLNISHCQHANNDWVHSIAGVQCLQELRMVACVDVEATGLKVLSSLPNLRHLDASYCYLTRGNTTLCSLSTLCGLQRLSLDGTVRVTDDDVARLSALETLVHLNLGGCSNLTNACGEVLFSAFAQLESLVLRDCSRLTGGVLELASPRLRLKKLVLSGCIGFTDDDIRFVAVMRSLARLGLERCPGLTDRCVRFLCRLVHLTWLNVSYNPNFTVDGMKRLSMLYGLHTVEMRGCTQIGSDGARRLNLHWQHTSGASVHFRTRDDSI